MSKHFLLFYSKKKKIEQTFTVFLSIIESVGSSFVQPKNVKLKVNSNKKNSFFSHRLPHKNFEDHKAFTASQSSFFVSFFQNHFFIFWVQASLDFICFPFVYLIWVNKTWVKSEADPKLFGPLNFLILSPNRPGPTKVHSKSIVHG